MYDCHELQKMEKGAKGSFEYIPDVESLRFWEILRPLRAGKEPFDLGYSGVPNGKGSIAPSNNLKTTPSIIVITLSTPLPECSACPTEPKMPSDYCFPQDAAG